MKKVLNLLTLFIALLAFSSCAKDEVVSTGIITGVVTNANNVNIAGASVTLNPLGITKSTGSDGVYNFESVEPGTYTLLVNAEGYQSDKKTVSVYAGQTAVADFMLGSSSGQASVSPLTLSFGPTVDQLAFEITNKGNQSLQYSISGYPAYLTVSPASAQIAAKGKQSVSVKVNRNLLDGNASTQLTVNIGNDSYVVSVNINSADLTSKISVSPTTLNFGDSYSELQFTIRNVGTSGDLAWNIPTPANRCLRVSPSSGVTSVGSSNQVTVTLDRSMMDADITSAFVNVVTEGGSIPVTVTATKSGSGGGSDNPTGNIAVRSGLMAYYTFDDGTADDITENELDGTLINNPSFTTETANGSGKAVFFNSQKDQSMSIPYNPWKNISNYTATMWVKDFSYGSFLKIESGSYNPRFEFYYDEDGFFKYRLNPYDSGMGTFAYDAKSLIDGKWHMIAITRAGGLCELYVDGVLVANKEVHYNDISEESSIMINNHMYFDNLRFYNRRLKASEMKEIYDSEK